MIYRKLFFVTAFVCGGCAVIPPEHQPILDPYDPRNNIPLLQASTRTSGVNVETKRTQTTPIQVSISGSSVQKLRDIKALKDEGILTQNEYDAKKAEILKGM